MYQRQGRPHFAIFSLLGLHILDFGLVFPFILALWAFISFYFGSVVLWAYIFFISLHFGLGLSWPFSSFRQALLVPVDGSPDLSRCDVLSRPLGRSAPSNTC